MPEWNPTVCGILVTWSWGLNAAGAELALVLPVSTQGWADQWIGSAAQWGELWGTMPKPRTGTGHPVRCEGRILPRVQEQ